MYKAKKLPSAAKEKICEYFSVPPSIFTDMQKVDDLIEQIKACRRDVNDLRARVIILEAEKIGLQTELMKRFKN
jgi:ubiquinone biosynthesis protein UbiJ